MAMGMGYGCCCRCYWPNAECNSSLSSCFSISKASSSSSSFALPYHFSSTAAVKLFPSTTMLVSLALSDDNSHKSPRHRQSASSARGRGRGEESGEIIKGSGTTARGRRLLRIREEKQRREYDRLHNYPAWAKVLEDACKDDTELRAVLGDSIGNPELMRTRVEDRVRKKGRDFRKSKTGSVVAFKVSFRE